MNTYTGMKGGEKSQARENKRNEKLSKSSPHIIKNVQDKPTAHTTLPTELWQSWVSVYAEQDINILLGNLIWKQSRGNDLAGVLPTSFSADSEPSDAGWTTWEKPWTSVWEITG